MTAFAECLEWILYRECGWPQKVGEPFRRTRDGAYWDGSHLVAPSGVKRGLPSKPDGMAFDDDPHDTGGRTCMGVLQRVYNGYRDANGLPRQDVWRILDDEISDIYYRQYWLPLRLDELPLGVNVKTFDMGVNAGIGTGARCLQRAVGAGVDGHIGDATLAAVRQTVARVGVDVLLQRLHDERTKYYKQCRTYWKHGPGWLKRNAATLTHAKLMASRSSTAIPMPVEDSQPEAPAKQSAKPETKNSMTESTSGRMAEGVAGTGAAGVGATAAKAVKDAPPESSSWDIVLAVLADPVAWLFLFTVAGAAYVWLERRRIMRQMGV